MDHFNFSSKLRLIYKTAKVRITINVTWSSVRATIIAGAK